MFKKAVLIAALVFISLAAHAGPKSLKFKAPVNLVIKIDKKPLNRKSPKNEAQFIKAKYEFAEDLILDFAKHHKIVEKLTLGVANNQKSGAMIWVEGLPSKALKKELQEKIEKSEYASLFKILDDSSLGEGGSNFYEPEKHYPIVRETFEKHGVLDFLEPPIGTERVITLDDEFHDETPERQNALRKATDESYEKIFEPIRNELLTKIKRAGLEGSLFGKGILYMGGSYPFINDDIGLDFDSGPLDSIFGEVAGAENLWLVVKEPSDINPLQKALGIKFSRDSEEGRYGHFRIYVVAREALGDGEEGQRWAESLKCGEVLSEKEFN